MEEYEKEMKSRLESEVKQILNCMDLTSLSGSESNDELISLCEVGKRYDVASICVYPFALSVVQVKQEEKNEAIIIKS